jgi:putative chitinase
MKAWRKGVIILTVVVLLQLLIGVTVSEAAPSNAGGVYHRVRWGETLSGIAVRYCTTVWAIQNANGIWNPNLIYAGQVLYIPTGWCGYHPPYHGTCGVYTVRWGDTLHGIARYYGVSAWAIAAANHIYNLNLIYAGQRLVIPCHP